MNQNPKDNIIAEAKALLKEVFREYEHMGMLAIYLWGSITRDDFDAGISDVDAVAIINYEMDLNARIVIREQIKKEFSRNMKFSVQFCGVEELNGGESYTVLGDVQPPGYLLLRFNDWMHVCGREFKRSDFSATNMTFEQAKQQQIEQVINAYKIIDGKLPLDPRRAAGAESTYQDIIKGVMGALYWQSAIAGNKDKLNYGALPTIVKDSYKPIVEKLLDIRATNHYDEESVNKIRQDVMNVCNELSYSSCYTSNVKKSTGKQKRLYVHRLPTLILSVIVAIILLTTMAVVIVQKNKSEESKTTGTSEALVPYTYEIVKSEAPTERSIDISKSPEATVITGATGKIDGAFQSSISVDSVTVKNNTLTVKVIGTEGDFAPPTDSYSTVRIVTNDLFAKLPGISKVKIDWYYRAAMPKNATWELTDSIEKNIPYSAS